jgi:hypothetical protein
MFYDECRYAECRGAFFNFVSCPLIIFVVSVSKFCLINFLLTEMQHSCTQIFNVELTLLRAACAQLAGIKKVSAMF